MSRSFSRIALALASGAFAAIGFEIAWRSFVSAKHGPTTNAHYVVPHPEYGWSYRPGTRAVHATRDFQTEIRIDEEGHREAERRPETAPDPKVRILCVGDSQTFGWGVAEEETFAALLRERLAARVWNHGICGYGTDQQYLKFQREGLELAPDVVIVTYCGNDVREVLYDSMYGHPKPRFEWRNGELRLERTPAREPWLERHSHYLQWLDRHADERALGRMTHELHQRGRRIVRALYRKMNEDCTRVGARLVVVADGETWLGDAFEDGTRLPYLDLREIFDREGRERIHFGSDPHWTVRAHEIVAHELERFLARNP